MHLAGIPLETIYQECNDNAESNQGRKVKFLYQMNQLLPVASEVVSRTADHRRPKHCSREVEKQKPEVGHVKRAGKWPCHDPQAGNEPRDEHRPVAVSQENGLCALESIVGKQEPLTMPL